MEMINIKRSCDEINDLLNRCVESEETGESIYPGMSYEQGIKAGIEWIIGQTNDNPLDD